MTLHEKGKEEYAILSYELNKASLCLAWRHEGRYLLRTNLSDEDPAKLWNFYL